MKLIPFILMLSIFNTPQGFNDRRILVISASERSSEVQNQLDLLQKNSLELETRRMAVFTLIDGELTAEINSSQRSHDFVENNMSDYTEALPVKIYLIGLDQGVKKTFTDVVLPQEVFEIVDSMPMRKAEMRKN